MNYFLILLLALCNNNNNQDCGCQRCDKPYFNSDCDDHNHGCRHNEMPTCPGMLREVSDCDCEREEETCHLCSMKM